MLGHMSLCSCTCHANRIMLTIIVGRFDEIVRKRLLLHRCICRPSFGFVDVPHPPTAALNSHQEVENSLPCLTTTGACEWDSRVRANASERF